MAGEWSGPGDGECTWWPDRWGDVVLTGCCRLHDAAGTAPGADEALARCIAALVADHWWLAPLPFVVWVGVRVFGPLRRAWLRRRPTRWGRS